MLLLPMSQNMGKITAIFVFDHTYRHYIMYESWSTRDFMMKMMKF